MPEPIASVDVHRCLAHEACVALHARTPGDELRLEVCLREPAARELARKLLAAVAEPVGGLGRRRA